MTLWMMTSSTEGYDLHTSEDEEGWKFMADFLFNRCKHVLLHINGMHPVLWNSCHLVMPLSYSILISYLIWCVCFKLNIQGNTKHWWIDCLQILLHFFSTLHIDITQQVHTTFMVVCNVIWQSKKIINVNRCRSAAFWINRLLLYAVQCPVEKWS